VRAVLVFSQSIIQIIGGIRKGVAHAAANYSAKAIPMNQRDWDLLNKQFVWLRPAPRYGSLKLAATVAILLTGLGVGSTIILHDPNTTEVAGSAKAPLAILASYDTARS
jgi:hypothetical protein